MGTAAQGLGEVAWLITGHLISCSSAARSTSMRFLKGCSQAYSLIALMPAGRPAVPRQRRQLSSDSPPPTRRDPYKLERRQGRLPAIDTTQSTTTVMLLMPART